MRLDEGLVFLSDTRTNAGVDNISTYRKLHVLPAGAEDRLFVLQSAGSLATTQEVLDRIDRDLATPGERESLASVGHLFEAALYVGRLRRQVGPRHSARARRRGHGDVHPRRPGRRRRRRTSSSCIPEGNYIRASDDRPFLQIGESKYGKFMLERRDPRAHRPRHGDQDRARLDDEHGAREPLRRPALRPRPSTAPARSTLDEHRFAADSPVLEQLREVWERNILNAVAELPDVALSEPGPGDAG